MSVKFSSMEQDLLKQGGKKLGQNIRPKKIGEKNLVKKILGQKINFP